MAKRLRETREEREDELRELIQDKLDKKGFAGETLALLCADGSPISYKKLIRCPDSFRLVDRLVCAIYGTLCT